MLSWVPRDATPPAGDKGGGGDEQRPNKANNKRQKPQDKDEKSQRPKASTNTKR